MLEGSVEEPELTPALHQAIIELVRGGHHPETSSAFYGVTQAVFDKWMALAAEKVEPYASLKADFEKYKEEMTRVRATLLRRTS